MILGSGGRRMKGGGRSKCLADYVEMFSFIIAT
jgi:hypothetical protein